MAPSLVRREPFGSRLGRRCEDRCQLHFNIDFSETDPTPQQTHTSPRPNLAPISRTLRGSHTSHVAAAGSPPPSRPRPRSPAAASRSEPVCFLIVIDRPVDPRGLADGGGHGDALGVVCEVVGRAGARRSILRCVPPVRAARTSGVLATRTRSTVCGSGPGWLLACSGAHY